MSWRIENKEENYSDAKLIAWEIVLPYRHLHILDSDEDKVKKVEERLKELLTTYEMHVISKHIRTRLNLSLYNNLKKK